MNLPDERILPMRAKAFLFAILLLLCGCSAKAPQAKAPPVKSGNYTTTANISYKDLKATATISQEDPSSCSVVFSSPPSLVDMAFIFRRDSVDLNYKGLSFQFDPSSMPGSAVAKLTVAAINNAMKDDGIGVALDNGALQITGMTESGEFTLTLDGKTGSLLKLSVPGEELEIAFENFRFLEE